MVISSDYKWNNEWKAIGTKEIESWITREAVNNTYDYDTGVMWEDK